MTGDGHRRTPEYARPIQSWCRVPWASAVSGSARVPRALVDPFGHVFDDYSSDEFELALQAPDPLWMPSADLWPDDGVTRIEERLLGGGGDA
jgi:hypothetical protein